MKRFIIIAAIAGLFLTAAAPSRALAKNIGFYSGTFDPPHQGHIALSLKAVELLDLDRLYMLPNYEPSHKPNASSFAQRYEMMELVVMRHKALCLPGREEFPRAYMAGGTEYLTVLISRIRELEGEEGNAFFHLCGTDSFNRMRESGRLPSAGENRIVAVFRRKGYSEVITAGVKDLEARGKVRFFDVDIPELSSSAARALFARGEVPDETVCPCYISWYAEREKLYGFPEKPLSLGDLEKAGIQGFTVSEMPLPPFSFSRHMKEHPAGDFTMSHGKSSAGSGELLPSEAPPGLLYLVASRKTLFSIVFLPLREALPWVRSRGYEKAVVFKPEKAGEGEGFYYVAALRDGRLQVFAGTARREAFMPLLGKWERFLLMNLLIEAAGFRIFSPEERRSLIIPLALMAGSFTSAKN
ncbi:MAG: nicotinate-nicotinamide nucleotide adenylyltransferase [Candidatus Eremiobacteraeota bacterium]|nr:nicotinate-nicotinamide nucleotide adenylyltransferase [Candidatus Eremiobacteraeota bacterium]